VVVVTGSAGDLSRRRVLQTAAGTAAAAATGAAVSGSAAAQDGEGVPAEYDGWFTGDARGGEVQNYDGTTTDRTGQSEVTLTVGADGNGGTFAYEPPALRISPGTTVTFDWVSDTHNVLVESQPEGAGWEGHDPIEDTGFSFSHTFEAEGVYTYYCDPHLSLGMKGAIVVGPAPAGGDGQPDGAAGGGGGGPPLWVTGLAGGALLALLAPVILSYYRYWDEDAGEGTAIPAGEPVPETADAEPVEEIGHDEYDPIGTAALIVVYALILLVMWVFMYFVEFLGNGPTVIG
jgi:halocyanin-like protein